MTSRIHDVPRQSCFGLAIGADSMGPAGLAPPPIPGPGAHHKVEPQNFSLRNLIFMYYFNKLTQLLLDLHNDITWY